MILKPSALGVAAVASLAAIPAAAATQFGDYVTLSGFGTAGVVASDNDKVDFVRDGAPKGAGDNASWAVDSKIGLQANFKANDWLSATVQVLAEQRHTPGVKAEFEWAYVNLKPLDNLSIRVGRTAPAVFMVSDSRNVGYANTMVRMPNDVYALNSLKRLTGVDATYRLDTPLGGLSISGMAGEGLAVSGGTTNDAKKVRGINAVFDTAVGSFRLGQVRTDVHVQMSGAIVPYTFSGVGYQLDVDNFVVMAEYVKRSISGPYSIFGAKGWYVMGGYRMGQFTPYLAAARTRVDNVSANVLNGHENTLTAGVRWDVVPGAAVKLQLDQVDPKGGRGISFPMFSPGVGDKTRVLSLAVDFVF
ncbi:MAG: porin [Acidovorax sp.]|uniref:porin n=1 Tax=Acidovorax sp. TaxID=1872122 RepID=UPI0039E27545